MQVIDRAQKTPVGSRAARGTSALALLALSLLAQPAQADVIEIGEDGAQTVYSGPAVYGLDGVSPILLPRPAQGALSGEIGQALTDAAGRHGLEPALLEAVAWNESRFHQTAVSPRGAIGVMQLMPATAAALGVDPHDTAQNIEGGATYLRQMLDRYRGDVSLALAAYNAGPGAVDQSGGVPAFRETRAYVGAVLARAARSPPVQVQPIVTPVILIAP